MGRGKDRWDKANVILKPLGGLLTAIVIAFLGFYVRSFFEQRQSQQENFRLLAELSGKREETGRILQNEMFMRLVESFGETQHSIDEKVLELELLAINLSDYISVRPFFEYLRDQIDGSDHLDPAEKQGYLKRLLRIAREVSSKQMVILSGAGDICDSEISFEEWRGPIRLAECSLSSGGINADFYVTIFDVDKETEELDIALEVVLSSQGGKPILAGFRVGVFDFPLSSRLRLPNNMACAVVLNEFDDSGALISIIYYPIRLATWDQYNLFRVRE